MATIKINCPKCVGTGITGNVVEGVCSQCKGTGTITAQDTDTIAAINTASVNAGGSAVVVTTPMAVPRAAVKVSSRKDN